jgi:MoaA/NifB/PqqE/SkfB family radical SAM enzyme
VSACSTTALDPRVEHLWPLPVPEFGVAALRAWDEAALRARLTGDRVRDNLVLNKWEFAHGVTVLRSHPWRLSVPFVLCNAQCEFCAAWQMKGNAPLLELMQALAPVLRHCLQVDLVGWGEPLIHPQFGDVLGVIRRETDARARLALTTNGTRLAEWVDRLLEARVTDYAVSIHAAQPRTHEDLMGLPAGEFERVLAGVRALTARKREFPGTSVETVLVVTQQNLAEIPDFLALSADLGADSVHLRTLMPMDSPRAGLDYHRLPPYQHPRFEYLRDAALAAVARSPLRVRCAPDTWGRPVFGPEWEPRLGELPLTPRSERTTVYRMVQHRWDELGAGEASAQREPDGDGANPYGRTAPHHCPSPYTAFYVNGTDRRVIPCVYMYKVPGHEFLHFKPSMTFEEVWNCPAMVAVRRRLHEGPLLPACRKCPFDC